MLGSASTLMRAIRARYAASAWLLAGTIGAGVLSYGTVAISTRVLGPADFGLLGALLAVASLSTVLLRPANYAAAQLATGAVGRLDPGALRGLGGLALTVSAVLALILLLVLLVASRPLQTMLQTNSFWPVALLAPLLAAMACVQLVDGLVAGAQRFRSLAAMSVVDAATRALFTAPLALLLGLPGVMIAYIAGAIASAVIAVVSIGGLGWWYPSRGELRAGASTGASTLALLLSIAALQSLDLVLVRSYADPDAVGFYAACASAGGLLVALSSPLYVPAFPRAVAAYRARRPALSILLGALGPIGVGGFVAVVGAAWLGPTICRLLFGPSFERAGDLLPTYLAKTIGLIVAGVVGQHVVAVRRDIGVRFAPIVACVAIGALASVRPPALGAAWLMVAAAIALIVIISAGAIRRNAPPLRASDRPATS